MKPARFQYQRPGELGDALRLLRAHDGDYAVLAGGQSLMPMLNLRVAQPAVLIDINDVPDLDTISHTDGVLSVGGRARHNDVLRSDLVRRHAPLLTQALAHVAHEAIRNRGTLGGSLALADPAAEMPACAVCLDATIVVASVAGERKIPATEFFKGIYTTALSPGDLIVRVEYPGHDAAWRFAFDEVARRRGDFAIAGLALGLRFERDRVCEARIVFAGVEEAPRRLSGVEACFASGGPDADKIARAGERLHADLQPLDGGEFSQDYRRHVAAGLLAKLATALTSAPTREQPRWN